MISEDEAAYSAAVASGNYTCGTGVAGSFHTANNKAAEAAQGSQKAASLTAMKELVSKAALSQPKLRPAGQDPASQNLGKQVRMPQRGNRTGKRRIVLPKRPV